MLKQYYKNDVIEAGCDEAGRGCLAGPVCAAAVILPHNFENQLINDSKKLNEKQRFYLKDIIINESLAWAVAFVDNEEIDKINILNASIKAMHLALNQLKIIPEHIIIDGNRFKNYKEINHTCIVKGDSKYLSISAASILAKTFRDEYMQKIHAEFPYYSWDKNKAYPTISHREGIIKFGITKYHRKTFRLLPDQYKLDF
jgi:ribonuclease HII